MEQRFTVGYNKKEGENCGWTEKTIILTQYVYIRQVMSIMFAHTKQEQGLFLCYALMESPLYMPNRNTAGIQIISSCGMCQLE